jgi:hypothetical protein
MEYNSTRLSELSAICKGDANVESCNRIKAIARYNKDKHDGKFMRKTLQEQA